MLRGGADGFGGAASEVRGVLGPQLPGWLQQAAAQVLELAQPGGVMVSPRQPRDARSSTAQAMLLQLVSPGSGR